MSKLSLNYRIIGLGLAAIIALLAFQAPASAAAIALLTAAAVAVNRVPAR